MTAYHEIETDVTPPLTGPGRLIATGLADLRSHAGCVHDLRKGLVALSGAGERATRKAALRLVQQLDAAEPSVTLIGQVKAGKTTLLNAMIGRPGLLPADVNPWTSVVTALHLAPPRDSANATARFRFFDEAEWARLIESGGRLGELAARAGAEDELARVRSQITAMREKSRKRLGRRFEMMLGQEHDYDTVDSALIERYVCLGDDFDMPDVLTDVAQGRFADITRAADISLPTPGIPLHLCLRDTPGVNDTFMMREQVTIGAIRDSRLCVVVFSASQAMTAMDLALIRLIANVRAREVLIFVNRIHELGDPATEVPQIRARIRETLATHDGPTEAQVIFGSALWAEACLRGTFGALPPDSAAALLNWAAVAAMPDGASPPNAAAGPEGTVAIIWEMSGIPELYRALSIRIVEGTGGECLNKIARSALNLARGEVASLPAISTGMTPRRGPVPGRSAVTTALCAIEAASLAHLEQATAAALAGFADRLDRAHRNFLDRATASLIAHLEHYGDRTLWTYGADGLRVLLRSNYLKFGVDMQKATATTIEAARCELSILAGRLVDCGPTGFPIAVPGPLTVPPPVTLGQTIALDLHSGWWKGWWFRARGYQAFAARFQDLIRAETERMLHDLRIVQAPEIVAAARFLVEEFLAEQRGILMQLAATGEGAGQLPRTPGMAAAAERRNILSGAIATFERYAV